MKGSGEHSRCSGWVFGGVIESCHRLEIREQSLPRAVSRRAVPVQRMNDSVQLCTMLPLHWVPPALEITPASVRREERTFKSKSPFCCLNIFPVKPQSKHIRSVCLESSLRATSHQHLLHPHVEVMVEVLDNGTLHLCSTSRFQSAIKSQGYLSVPGGRGSSVLLPSFMGRKAEMQRG